MAISFPVVERSNPVQSLSPDELEALKLAAAWYANYHARIIAERADDPSASELARREQYANLLSGLRKLGVRLRDPLIDALPAKLEREAA